MTRAERKGAALRGASWGSAGGWTPRLWPTCMGIRWCGCRW